VVDAVFPTWLLPVRTECHMAYVKKGSGDVLLWFRT
jgi:hypothetical protein